MTKQDHQTPREFLDAVERRWGAISFDLAASAINAAVRYYYSEENSAFDHDWRELFGTLWLNPPFANIAPWAKKCSESAGPGRTILMLVPAAIDSNWFQDHVLGRAFIIGVNPRIVFVGERLGYPKPLMMCVWDGYGTTGLNTWRWKARRARKSKGS